MSQSQQPRYLRFVDSLVQILDGKLSALTLLVSAILTFFFILLQNIDQRMSNDVELSSTELPCVKTAYHFLSHDLWNDR